MISRIVLILSIIISLAFTGLYYYLLENYWLLVDAGDLVHEDRVWDKIYIVYTILMLASVVLIFKNFQYVLVLGVYLLLFPGVYFFSDFVSYESVKEKFYQSAKYEHPFFDSISVNLKKHKFAEVEKILLAVEAAINKGEGDEFAYRNAYSIFYSTEKDVVQAIEKWDKEKPGYHSKYALGISYLSQGWRLRGGGVYSDIPEENLAEMNSVLKKSIENLKQSLQLKNDLWVSYYYLINSLAVDGKKIELERVFNESISHFPYSYLLRYNYYVFRLRPQWGGSIESIRLFALEARENAKYNPRLMALYGFFYVMQVAAKNEEDRVEKIALYKKALEYAPLTSWYKGLVYEYYHLGDHQSKLKYQTLILNKISPKQGAYISRAYTYIRVNEVAPALADARKELELFPDNLSGSNQAAWLFYKYEEYDEAIKAFINSIRIDPQDRYAYRLLGDLYFAKTHQLDLALKMYLKAKALDDSEVRLDLLIADLKLDLKHRDAIIFLDKYFERVDVSDPKNKKDIAIAKVLKTDIESSAWFLAK